MECFISIKNPNTSNFHDNLTPTNNQSKQQQEMELFIFIKKGKCLNSTIKTNNRKQNTLFLLNLQMTPAKNFNKKQQEMEYFIFNRIT